MNSVTLKNGAILIILIIYNMPTVCITSIFSLKEISDCKFSNRSQFKKFMSMCSWYFEDGGDLYIKITQRNQYIGLMSDFISSLIPEIYRYLHAPISLYAHLVPLNHILHNDLLESSGITESEFFSRNSLYSSKLKAKSIRESKNKNLHENMAFNSPIRFHSSLSRPQGKTVKNEHYQNLTKREGTSTKGLPHRKNKNKDHQVGQNRNAVSYYRLKHFQCWCRNFLIITENEIPLLNYFRYAAKLDFLWNPRARYVILMFSANDANFTDKSAYVLSTLWEEFGIINVIIREVSLRDFSILEPAITYQPFTATERKDKIYIFDSSTMNSAIHIMSLKTFNGYPLRVTMFNRTPTAMPIRQCNTSARKNCAEFVGMDAFFIETLCEHLNFTPMIRIPLDVEDYGSFSNSGIYTGIIGDILYRRADIAMNGLFIKTYGTNKIEFTCSAYSDMVCIVVPKEGVIPKWLAIFEAIHTDVLIYILVIYIVNIVVLLFLKKLNSLWVLDEKITETSCSLIILDMLRPFVSSPFSHLPKATSKRLFIFSCLVFGLIITSTMQGIVYTTIANPYYYPDINTLEELDKSGLRIYTNSPSLADTFGKPTNKSNLKLHAAESLSRKVHTYEYNGTNFWEQIAYERNGAVLARKSDFQNGVPKHKFERSDGSELLHLMKDCPRDYLLGYIVPKGSPYLFHINNAISKLIEGGFFIYWEQDVQFNINIRSDKKSFKSPDSNTDYAVATDEPKVISLTDLQLAFYVLLVGWFSSIFVFTFEYVFLGKWTKQKTKTKKYTHTSV